MMTDLDRSAPIGVFDSGVGGLSVLRHIQQQLPAESLIYVADSAHLPYGSKHSQQILQRSLLITRFLLAQGVKAIVVACNTATAAAVVELRRQFILPVIGVEPGVKPGIHQSRGGVVGVLATEGTLGSEKFQRLVAAHGPQWRVVVQPCRGWVEQVESGALDSARTRALVVATVAPLLRQGVDTLVLGCTHYPFLERVIREVAGPEVAIVDTGGAIARELGRRLSESGLLTRAVEPGRVQFWASGDPRPVGEQVARLWRGNPSVKQLPTGLR